MKIGIPKGLMYYNYESFITKFLKELDIETIISQDTNKEILNLGVKYSIDEACLPLKVFHGHVAWLKDKCDLIIVPRIMKSESGHFICPKFCGLPDTIKADIPNLPEITSEPLYLNSKKKVYKWCKKLVYGVEKRNNKIQDAFEEAIRFYNTDTIKVENNTNSLKVLIAGHPYNIKDQYVNMKLKQKLKKLNIDILTEELINRNNILHYVNKLNKKPFWSFLVNNYGSCLYVAKEKRVDGIIYISSFACGIDSICIELIKSELTDFPMLVLKVDEQTGEEGLNTRIEAFVDMLERRKNYESNLSALR